MVFDFFKNKKEELQKEEFRIEDLVLSKLKVGFLVDYDLKTYRVSACNNYQWNEGGVSDEWELTSGSETFFLERSEEDGEVEWSFCHKLSISELEGDIAGEIVRNEDPPEKVVLKGETFHFEEDDIGEFFRDGSEEGLSFVSWDYSDEQGKQFLTIEQWGEKKFDMQLGTMVEEFQFTNILPSE
ncbi:MAG: DUF4178 domain-containing protein [Nitrospina sp.]|nr:DUF4178 domain-containing protein [Nitrospina sp.]MBT6296492.1 DUF4178 domain-containing protein [Nitrospina sp.]